MRQHIMETQVLCIPAVPLSSILKAIAKCSPREYYISRYARGSTQHNRIQSLKSIDELDRDHGSYEAV